MEMNVFKKKLLHGIHDSIGHVVHNIIIYKSLSYNFQFFLFSIYHSFCWNLQINSTIKTCRHKFQQTSGILKTQGKLKIMRDNIVDENSATVIKVYHL